MAEDGSSQLEISDPGGRAYSICICKGVFSHLRFFPGMSTRLVLTQRLDKRCKGQASYL